MLHIINILIWGEWNFSFNNFYVKCVSLIAIGLPTLVGGFQKVWKKRMFIKRGVWVEGEVCELIAEPGSNNKICYYPVIQYSTLDNKIMRRNYDVIRSSPSIYALEEKVTVIYDPNNVGEFILDNRSSNLVSWFFIIVGLLFTLMGAIPLLKSFN